MTIPGKNGWWLGETPFQETSIIIWEESWEIWDNDGIMSNCKIHNARITVPMTHPICRGIQIVTPHKSTLFPADFPNGRLIMINRFIQVQYLTAKTCYDQMISNENRDVSIIGLIKKQCCERQTWAKTPKHGYPQLLRHFYHWTVTVMFAQEEGWVSGAIHHTARW